MAMKKPDRFEREVDKLPHLFDTDDLETLTPMILRDDVVTLLRKQHKAVVRMVKKVEAWQCEQLAEDSDAIGVILDELKKRATEGVGQHDTR